MTRPDDDASSSHRPAAASTSPGLPGQTIERPAPGSFARGVWEAPAWAFYVAVAVVLVAGLVYAARVAGLFPRRKPDA